LKTTISVILIVGCLILFPQTGSGASASCSVSTAGVNFGAYNPLNSINVDSTGTVTVSCTVYLSVTIAIGPSDNTGGFNPRALKQSSGSDLLNYNLYTASDRTTIWGDGTQGTATLNQYVRKQTPWVATVYARTPPGQDVYTGLYNDSLVVTINY
jgi:spore coat protein U-like protein